MMMTRFARAALVALLVTTSAPAFADGLVDNVDGFTLDDAGQVVRFTGIVVSDDGHVKKLLAKKDKRPKDGLTYRYDGEGRHLMPGLIDAHGHVIGLGFQALLLDLSDTSSLAEALDRIAKYSAANPDVPWILGRGWNQEKWGLGRYPTAAELDAVTGNRPAFLERVDGHASWANSKAIAAAQVTAKTPTPEGGRVEMANGKPAGVFVDNAQSLVQRVVPQPLPRDYDRALAAAQAILLENGITAIADMGTDMPAWQAFRRAGDLNRLNVRIISYGMGIENMVAIAGPHPTPWLYEDRLRMVGVKLYLDGALGSRGAWLKAPYADAPDQTGLPMLSYSELRNKLVRASMDGFQVAVHAIGDRANQEVLDAIDSVVDRFGGDRRWRIEHAQIVDPADLPRFGKNGIVASMQPVHQTSDWKMATVRMGPDLSPTGRLGGAYAWGSMLRNGAHLAFGSDVPVESPNPFPGIAVAMTRLDAEGQPLGGWIPRERVTREQAIAAFTTGGAYAGFAEDRLGSLTPGKRADFVLLDIDPLTADPETIRNAKVAETWIGGQRAYVRGNTPRPAEETKAVRGANAAPEGR
ncbi:amidohydrolase family protein [Sphingorhabdus soli]|uniref:Amidohydrolase family protein n=1 Tax=Flavisphingopyxis soli TaxID=2601267 RepID=A0A5C6U9Q5_9SPHN|nr:amidohydrolase [Sphingorhabdus soli]TXC68298.1 amidohydrolase family protein [Sphingorhabdus soli]